MASLFFTRPIYTAIKYAVAYGDVAPFVGHNAFLRWSALQEIAFEQDGSKKYWSEEIVWEDFDLALRLQIPRIHYSICILHYGWLQRGRLLDCVRRVDSMGETCLRL